MRLLVPAFFAVTVFFSGLVAEAASLYLDPSEKTIAKGESVILTLRLDTTSDECINSVDGVLNFDNGLQVTDISTGNSIFSLWVEAPVFDNDTKEISFAGGIPNGYCGRIDGDPRLTNSLMEIVVRAPSFSIGETGLVPERNISFAETTNAYLNDGLGTVAKIEKAGATIVVTDSQTSDKDEWRDKVQADEIPPKRFSITLTSDPSAFKGKYFIVFNTTDKQTGIDHYEVIEEPISELNLFKFGAVTAPWKQVTSPYVLEDQTLNSTVRVKAIDKAGNEYIATLIPDESLRGVNYETIILYGLMLLSVLVLLACGWFAWWFWRRRHYEYEEIIEYEYEEEEEVEDDEEKEDKEE